MDRAVLDRLLDESEKRSTVLEGLLAEVERLQDVAADLKEMSSAYLTCKSMLATEQQTVRDLQMALTERYGHGRREGWTHAIRHVVSRLLGKASAPENAAALSLLVDAAKEFEAEAYRP